MDPVERFINLCRDKTTPFGHILDFSLDHPTVFCGGEWEKILQLLKEVNADLNKPLNISFIYILLFDFAVKQSTSKKFKKQLWSEFRAQIKRIKQLCKTKKIAQKYHTMAKMFA